MCVKPNHVWVAKGPHFEKQAVPCNHCWACLQNKVDDLVGRCLMEQSESDWTLALTLTYDDKRVSRPDQTKRIYKTDLQEFFYRLRKRKQRTNGVFRYNIRYLAAGEYGSSKGRTHFHIILFGKDCPRPQIAIKKHYQYFPDNDWPWGFCFADDQIDHRAMRYVAKYLVKQKAETSGKKRNHHAQEWLTYSKVPLLGAPGISRLAAVQADAQIMPTNLRYTPPGARPKSQYNLFGIAEYIYFDELLRFWPSAGSLPANEWVSNARLRYFKAKALKQWSKLQRNYALHVCDYYINQMYDPKSRQMALPELTNEEKSWQVKREEYENLQREEDRNKWHADHRANRTVELQQLRRLRAEWRHDMSTR